MVHRVALWVLASALLGAGIFNARGQAGTQSDFARWGYPAWWNIFTGGAEILSAGLLTLPATRIFGLALGAAIIAAAAATVLRHREFAHLAPLGAFAVLIGVVVGF